MFQPRRAMLGAALLAVTISMLPASASAKPEPAARSLEQLVGDAVVTRVGRSTTEIAAAGRTLHTDVQRTDATRTWAFGIGMLRAPAKADEYPAAWLFLAQRQASGWSVALEYTQDFIDLARKAPATIFSASERNTFEAAWSSRSSLQTLSGNTGLRLPYELDATWTMVGGTHGWNGSDKPFSSVDLSGGDGIVRAADAGSVYTLCADDSNGGTAGGWRRVYHASGYTTDYYHLWGLTTLGATVSEGDALGNVGKNLCAGGSASSPHVHWSILNGTTRVGWQWRSAGKWVFWNGSTAYDGYALHGSTRVNRWEDLYNYGKLGPDQGVVDAWGSGTINRRSGPGTGYPIVGSAADGITVTISCWSEGTSIDGRYGSSTIWDKLSDGTWVSDALVYTGVGILGSGC